MKNKEFTKISGSYEANSLVQNSAAIKLLKLAKIKENEDIPDLGCGPGHLTKIIREQTNGAVTGIDSSSGMVTEAKSKYPDIEFIVKSAEELNYRKAFDLIFCNSAFMWFDSPDETVEKCFRALKPGGRIAIQAPAKKIYSPQFVQAVTEVSFDLRTKKTFSSFRNPWFFLETSKMYSHLFEHAGFEVGFCELQAASAIYTLEEAFRIFKSGAAAGYLNQAYYDLPISRQYEKDFCNIVKNSFREQASSEDEKILLLFNRIYLVAGRPV